MADISGDFLYKSVRGAADDANIYVFTFSPVYVVLLNIISKKR